MPFSLNIPTHTRYMIVHATDHKLMPVLCVLHDWVAAQVRLSTVALQLVQSLTSWTCMKRGHCS